MNIKRIGNIILEVTDLDVSVKFYHEVLGMPIKNERRNWVDLGQQSGGVLSLHPASITTTSPEHSKENGILILESHHPNFENIEKFTDILELIMDKFTFRNISYYKGELTHWLTFQAI